MTTSFLVWGHEAAFLAYLVFAALVAMRSSRTLHAALFLIVMLLTAAWAQSFVAVYLGYAPVWLEGVMAASRDGSWLALSLALMHRHANHTTYFRVLAVLSALLVVLQIGLGLNNLIVGPVAGVRIDATLIRMAMTILGFVILENVMRNASKGELWALKHWAIGFSGVLLLQLLSRIPEFLTHQPDLSLAVANPLVYIVALPFFVVSSTRLPQLKVRVHSSRRFAFYSTTLIAVGIMLQGIALAAWYVRTYGGSNGTALAAVVAFSGVAAVLAALVSSGVRSRFRRFINENFFSLKYDYRVEWEKAIRELAVNPGQDTPERVLRILCDLMDTSGGAIWLYRESWRQFTPAAKRGDTAVVSPVPENDARIEALRLGDESFASFEEDGRESGLFAPWRKFVDNAWIVVPMRYRSAVAGFAILNQPRSPRILDWEDQSLLRLVAMQLAAYLVQEETAQSLADARQLEDFNKRFAFVVHDIKNTIGQLRLMVSNITKFGDEKEFRDDMVITLGNSVERLEGMLKSLTVVGTQRPIVGDDHQVIDLIDFLEKFTKEKCSLGHTVLLGTNLSNSSLVRTDFDILHRVLEHVVSNALEAGAAGAAVKIDASVGKNALQIAVLDQGSGMTQQFVNEELFRPLKTTKRGGFGIGGYQIRELMRDLGGDVTVESTVGKGTCVTLSLPLISK